MSEEWREKHQNKYIQFEEIGDSITGMFTAVKEEEYMGKATYRPILIINNEERILPSHVALLRALQPIEYGTEIEITLKETVKNKYGKSSNIYSVHKIEEIEK